MFLMCRVILLFISLPIFALGQSKPTNHSDEPSTIVIGFTASVFFDVNINDGRAAIKVLTEKLADKFGFETKAETIIFTDIALVVKAIKDKKIDLIGMLPSEFFEITEHAFLEPLAVPKSDERVFDQFLLLAHRESEIKELSGLRNKKLVIETKGRGGSSVTWLNTILLNAKLPESKDFFLSITEANTAYQTVLPVFFKQADACVVGQMVYETMVELNPQLGQDLVNLARSPGYCFGLLCCRKGFVEEYEGNVLNSLLELHQDPQGKQLLKIFRIDKFVSFQPYHLESVEMLYDDYQKLLQRRSK